MLGVLGALGGCAQLAECVGGCGRRCKRTFCNVAWGSNANLNRMEQSINSAWRKVYVIKHACYVDSLQRTIKNMQKSKSTFCMLTRRQGCVQVKANILQCRGPPVQVQVNILQRSIKAASKIMFGLQTKIL